MSINKKNRHKGIYVGVYSGFVNSDELYHDTNSEDIVRSIQLGALSGYQIYIFNHIVIDFLIGLGASDDIYTKFINHPYSRVNYAIGPNGRISLNIGYLFHH